MDLPQHPAHAGLVLAQDHEEILHHKTQRGECVDDLHVRQPLLVCTNLVLAFDHINALRFEDSISFGGPSEVKVQHGFVILL